MIYCEPKPDEAILAEIAGSKKVFLLGCSVCANFSYCVQNGLESPAWAGLKGAVNVKQEIIRLKEVLSKRGIRTGTGTILALCFVTKEKREKFLERTRDYETVVTLSCEVGKRNAEGFLKGKNVVGAMTNKGFMRAIVDKDGITYRFEKDELYINNTKYAG